MVSLIIRFVPNTLTLQESAFLFAKTGHDETGLKVAFANLGVTVRQKQYNENN